MLLSKLLLSVLPLVAKTVGADSREADILQFENFGYSGTYWHVSEMNDIYSDDCSCKLSDKTTKFSGSNSPINEEVSVHFRGPLVLNKFAYYVSESFVLDGDDNEDWSRLAYYDADSQTADNVTFLTSAGKNSSCLGKALTFADSDGISKADESTVLSKDTLIKSEEEYVIFSNITCDKSGEGNDCGVYRKDNEAYHGYYGTTKMFVFEFTMPEEDDIEKGDVYNWNMPAIWLLNAYIPRTAQYSLNANCSCWRSGCGEFDIFEVKNYTEAEVQKLYATIHDYQGTDDIESGLQIDGYFQRDYTATMKGGVVFDDDGNAVVFMSNSTSFDENVSASNISSVIKDLGSPVTMELEDASVSAGGDDESSESSDKDSSGSRVSNLSSVIIAIFTFLLF